jgi:hypothetical protein
LIAVFVRVKSAGSAPDATVAVTVYVPTDPLAVNGGDVAIPLASVVAVLTPLANVPLAPAAGTSNVTCAPLTADPFDVTVTTSGAAKPALTVALCGVPLVAVIEMGAPVMFVSWKLAAVVTPTTEAVTE